MLLDNQQEGGYTVKENTLENKVEEICEDCESDIVDLEYNIYKDDGHTVIQIRHIDTGGPDSFKEKRGIEFVYKNKENFNKKDIYDVYLPIISEGEQFERFYVDYIND
jgi:hypothetical protein